MYFHICIDPGLYHSGFVYAQSIEVKNELFLNLNFFSPFGIAGTLLNGLWLGLTTDSPMSLLLLYGLITVVIGYLLQIDLRNCIPENLPKLIKLTWVATLATAMPWPSLLTTFFYLL